MIQELNGVPLDELMERAREIRDRQFGNRVTFSPKVFIPLTMLCADKCGYCTFAQPPARLESPYLEASQVLAIARAGAKVGVHEALFTLGERPELRYPAAAEWLDAHGYSSTIDYLAAMAKLVLDEVGLLPHANAGALYRSELELLRRVAPSQGMMVESINPDLDAHRGSPDKTPERRLATLEFGDSIHNRHPRRHRRESLRPHRNVAGHCRIPSPLGTHSGSHRSKLPAETRYDDVSVVAVSS